MEVGGGRSSVEAERTELEIKRLSMYSQKNHKRKSSQEITFFGFVWKRGKNDMRSSKLKADDVILSSKDGVGSSVKPTCYLCFKPYHPDLMYIRCEMCRNWFHGDALELEEARIAELISYRCCRCRRRPLPKCPHSDLYWRKRPEPEPIIEENAADPLSSEEAVGITDRDPSFASSGRVEEATVEETVHGDSSVGVKSFAPGSNPHMNFMDGSSHSTDPVSEVGDEHIVKEVRPYAACAAWYTPGTCRQMNPVDDVLLQAATSESNYDNGQSVMLHQAYDGFRVIAAETGSLYERLRQRDLLTNDDIMSTLDKLQHLAVHRMKDIACHQANGVVQPEAPPQPTPSSSSTRPSDKGN